MSAAPISITAPLVDEREDVCRLCFSADVPISRHDNHPNQIDPLTGRIRLEEISWEDLSSKGFSLQRRHLYSLEKAIREAERRDNAKSEKLSVNAGYKLAGVLIVRVARINEILHEGVKAFSVYATPQPGDPGHAEIRVGAHCRKHDLLKFRIALQTALGSMREPDCIDGATK